MLLDEVAQALDDLFSIGEWDADPAMKRWVPRVYQAIGYDYVPLLEADFCSRFNGLMLRSAERVEAVYCAAFPCPEVVRGVLAGARGQALLFLHHPVDMEVAGRGFLPVPPADLAQTDWWRQAKRKA